MLRTFILTLFLGSSLLVTACNTVDGAGEDLKSAGGAVSDAAK